MYLSKSKYCAYRQCEKLLWLKINKPDTVIYGEDVKARFAEGNEVGDLAMGLFGDFTEVTAYNEDGTLNLGAMVAKTEECLKDGTANICEAAFLVDGLYCAVDILRKCEGGYAVYEVKSTTEITDVYLIDVAFQKYVLKKCGINVVGTYIVHINNKYVRGDNLELDKLFKIEDVAGLLEDEGEIKNYIAAAKNILYGKQEPMCELALHCSKPYECACFKYCSALHDLPTPSVFDLYRISKKDAYNLYNDGCVTFNDVEAYGAATSDIQARQVDYYLHDRGTYIDKPAIRAFLSTLSYPLYFLDFEGMATTVPQYKGTAPNEQLPFQYSLHYLERPDGELKHKEFLAQSGVDPRLEIAESLCRDIPENACVAVYNKTYECGRINRLAELFPRLSGHLKNICDHIVDFIVPFRKGYYYKKEFGGSFKVKVVLPAMYPDDPDLNYHNLDGVHNGTEAMNSFPLIKDMPPEQAQKARADLLKYCALDTLALVKILQELERVSA